MDNQFFIWDLDGTLLDSYPIMIDAINSTLKEFGKSIDRVQLEQAVKQQVKKAHQEFAKDISYLNFKENWKAKEEKVLDTILHFPYTIETLSLIKSKKGKQYLYTHRDGKSCEYLLQKNNLHQFFEDIICEDNGFPKKPNPQALTYLIGRHKIPKEKACMIGDRDLDILAAKAAGIKGIYIGESAYPPQVDAIYKNLKEYYFSLLTN